MGAAKVRYEGWRDILSHAVSRYLLFTAWIRKVRSGKLPLPHQPGENSLCILTSPARTVHYGRFFLQRISSPSLYVVSPSGPTLHGPAKRPPLVPVLFSGSPGNTAGQVEQPSTRNGLIKGFHAHYGPFLMAVLRGRLVWIPEGGILEATVSRSPKKTFWFFSSHPSAPPPPTPFEL